MIEMTVSISVKRLMQNFTATCSLCLSEMSLSKVTDDHKDKFHNETSSRASVSTMPSGVAKTQERKIFSTEKSPDVAVVAHQISVLGI